MVFSWFFFLFFSPLIHNTTADFAPFTIAFYFIIFLLEFQNICYSEKIFSFSSVRQSVAKRKRIPSFSDVWKCPSYWTNQQTSETCLWCNLIQSLFRMCICCMVCLSPWLKDSQTKRRVKKKMTIRKISHSFDLMRSSM